ncbi:hypothetical protein [Thermococcus sp.]|uniref:hypothetical protein n=1 Tax=Thermococcus sp. TaxID=35749 RepID=UPI00341321B7
MPFLRGRLLQDSKIEGDECANYVNYLLNELELFYRRVSWGGRLDKRHWKTLRSLHRDMLPCLR